MKPVTWLFLDCFNTLLDEADGLTHQSGMEPLADIPVAHGLFGSEEAFLQTYLAWRRSAWSGPEYPEMCLHERLSRLLPGDAGAATTEMVARFEANYVRTLTPTPGVHEAITALSGRFRLGVVSNFIHPGMPRQLLEHFDLMRQVEFVLDSSEFGYKKPDTRIYAEALRLSGAKPEDIMFVGDSLRNDVQVPIAFGMQAVWFDRHAHGAPDGVTAFTEWEGFPLLN